MFDYSRDKVLDRRGSNPQNQHQHQHPSSAAAATATTGFGMAGETLTQQTEGGSKQIGRNQEVFNYLLKLEIS
jgi:hypothetical protein